MARQVRGSQRQKFPTSHFTEQEAEAQRGAQSVAVPECTAEPATRALDTEEEPYPWARPPQWAKITAHCHMDVTAHGDKCHIPI